MTSPTGYNLVWSDDFNSTLDETKWEIITTVNYPWQECNTNDNAYTDGSGNLVLRMKSGICPNTDPPVSGFGYTTGMISSRTSFQYGYFESRSKMSTNHVNNAFWLVGQNWSWPPEIDIYESEGYSIQPTKLWNAFHYGSSSNPQENGHENNLGTDYSLAYHVFGMEWTPTLIRWFIDDVEVYRIIPTANMLFTTIPMQVILSINKGWNISTQGDNLPTSYPLYHYVDYVRVYQTGCIPLSCDFQLT